MVLAARAGCLAGGDVAAGVAAVCGALADTAVAASERSAAPARVDGGGITGAAAGRCMVAGAALAAGEWRAVVMGRAVDGNNAGRISVVVMAPLGAAGIDGGARCLKTGTTSMPVRLSGPVSRAFRWRG